MRQVTLHITENKFSAFMEVAKSLSFIKKIEEDKPLTKEQFLTGLNSAVKEVKQIRKGKSIGISAKDLLNEL
jgi:ribonuclease PH